MKSTEKKSLAFLTSLLVFFFYVTNDCFTLRVGGNLVAFIIIIIIMICSHSHKISFVFKFIFILFHQRFHFILDVRWEKKLYHKHMQRHIHIIMCFNTIHLSWCRSFVWLSDPISNINEDIRLFVHLFIGGEKRSRLILHLKAVWSETFCSSFYNHFFLTIFDIKYNPRNIIIWFVS